MIRLNEETIQEIEQLIGNKETVEIHIEKGQVVLVKLKRKLVSKSPIE